jgi:hypothetical protein
MEESNEGTVKPPVGTLVPPVWWMDALAAGQTVTLTLKATGVANVTGPVETVVDAFDGQIDRGPWFFVTEVDAIRYAYLPLIMRNSGTLVTP